MQSPAATFSSESQKSVKDRNDESAEDEVDPSEYYDDPYDDPYDEYTDCEEFEDERDAEWEYDENGVAVYLKSGQPAMKVLKNELRLPMGLVFFLRTFGIIAVCAVIYYTKWYNGTLTLFGARYRTNEPMKISQVLVEKRGVGNPTLDAVESRAKEDDDLSQSSDSESKEASLESDTSKSSTIQQN